MRFPRQQRLRFILPLLLALALSACAQLGNSRDTPPPPPTLPERIEAATQRLLEANSEVTRYSPMIAATFVSIDNLAQSSTLGRIASELFASSLAQAGMPVREVKMRDSLFIEENVGELILTRQVQRLSREHDARSILMGTYAQGEYSIYISVRIVRASDAMVLGSTSLTLPIDNDLRAMLGGGW